MCNCFCCLFLGTGTGVSSNGMTGLKKSQTGSMSYGSTSHYLRQLVGTEKLKKGSEPTGKRLTLMLLVADLANTK